MEDLSTYPIVVSPQKDVGITYQVGGALDLVAPGQFVVQQSILRPTVSPPAPPGPDPVPSSGIFWPVYK